MSARTGRVFAAALAGALLLIAAAEPESRLEQYQRLRREAAADVKAGDLVRAEDAFGEALALYPDVPGSYIRLARVQAAAGALESALSYVRIYADMGLLVDIERDPALRVLTALPGYARVAARFEANAKPVGEVQEFATITGDPEFIGEGLIPHDKGWLLSTVSGRTVVRLTPTGATRFLKADAKTGAIFGMDADRRPGFHSGFLWAAEAWGEGVPGGVGRSRTGLLKVSLWDGRVLARFPLPDDGGKHQFGDVVVAKDGTVYATDSVGGGVWRLKTGEATLQRIVAPGRMASPQGMVLCPGEKAMVVADYATGLHRVDLSSGETRLLEGLTTGITSLPTGLAGTDGLIRAPAMDVRGPWAGLPHRLGVIATQNGVSPQRVVLLRISGGCDWIDDATVLAANLPGMDDVSLAAVNGRELVFVGHARWDARGDDGKLTTPTPDPIRVFSLTLQPPVQ